MKIFLEAFRKHFLSKLSDLILNKMCKMIHLEYNLVVIPENLWWDVRGIT